MKNSNKIRKIINFSQIFTVSDKGEIINPI